MAISVGGLASGLDTDKIISQLVTLQRRPIVQLQQREADYQVQLTAFGNLQGLLSSLQTSVQALQDPNSLVANSTSVSDTKLISASASSSAATGSYNITIQQLAQNQRLKSAAFASNTAAVGGGTLHVQIGTGAVTDISIDSAATLQDVATAINDTDAAVNAAVVFDGTNHFLTLSATESGEANTLSLTVTDADGNHTDTAGLSRFVFQAGVTENLTQTQAAKNAILDVDGITGISRSSNTITDVISGVTLTVRSAPAAPDNTVTVGVERQAGGIQGKLKDFIKAYNDVANFFKAQSGAPGLAGSRGPLGGDSTLNVIRRQLERDLSASVAGLAKGTSRLSELGVTSTKEGTLDLTDTEALDEALKNRFDDVNRFFTQDTAGSLGFAARLDATLENFLDGDNSLISARQEGINTSITRTQKQITRYEDRVSIAETRLRKQFTGLESLLSQYNTTSNFLSQQLSSLQNLNTAIANR